MSRGGVGNAVRIRSFSHACNRRFVITLHVRPSSSRYSCSHQPDAGGKRFGSRSRRQLRLRSCIQQVTITLHFWTTMIYTPVAASTSSDIGRTSRALPVQSATANWGAVSSTANEHGERSDASAFRFLRAYSASCKTAYRRN